MKSLARATLIGRLGRDPELRKTQTGMSVCNFSVATDFHQKKGEEWETHTTWHSCIAWDKKGERAQEQLKKGSYVYVEGTIRDASYTNNDGQKVSKQEITVLDFGLLEKREQDAAPEQTYTPQTANTEEEDQDALPF